jgi:hypothetical protein
LSILQNEAKKISYISVRRLQKEELSGSTDADHDQYELKERHDAHHTACWSDAERALVALVTRSALSPRPFRGNGNQISLSEKTLPQAETRAAIHALVPRDKSATPTLSARHDLPRPQG